MCAFIASRKLPRPDTARSSAAFRAICQAFGVAARFAGSPECHASIESK